MHRPPPVHCSTPHFFTAAPKPQRQPSSEFLLLHWLPGTSYPAAARTSRVAIPETTASETSARIDWRPGGNIVNAVPEDSVSSGRGYLSRRADACGVIGNR